MAGGKVISIDTEVTDNAASTMNKVNATLQDGVATMGSMNIAIRDAVQCPGCEALFATMEKLTANVETLANDASTIAGNLSQVSENAREAESKNLGQVF